MELTMAQYKPSSIFLLSAPRDVVLCIYKGALPVHRQYAGKKSKPSSNDFFSMSKICKLTGLTRSSVVGIVYNLREFGFCEVNRIGKYTDISLTPKGEALALSILGICTILGDK